MVLKFDAATVGNLDREDKGTAQGQLS